MDRFSFLTLYSYQYFTIFRPKEQQFDVTGSDKPLSLGLACEGRGQAGIGKKLPQYPARNKLTRILEWDIMSVEGWNIRMIYKGKEPYFQEMSFDY